MDLMNLAARLTLDMKDYEDSIGKATQSAQSFSKISVAPSVKSEVQ